MSKINKKGKYPFVYVVCMRSSIYVFVSMLKGYVSQKRRRKTDMYISMVFDLDRVSITSMDVRG